MRTLIKLSILLFLSVLIFGGAALATYELYLKPHKVASRLSKEDRIGLPLPDFSSSEFAAVLARIETAPLPEKRTALLQFLANYPKSSQAGEARRLLGKWDIEDFFSSEIGPEKTVYIVKPGDSLTRIASRNRVSFDLLVRANNLDRLLIHPGDKFLIPSGDFSLEIGKDGMFVTLKNHGVFFKEYAVLRASLPSNWQASGVQIGEKLAWHDGQRVAFGDKDYAGSSRWLALTQPGVTLYSVVKDGSPTDVEKPYSGLELGAEDLEELFALVNRGTPVTIAPQTD